MSGWEKNTTTFETVLAFLRQKCRLKSNSLLFLYKRYSAYKRLYHTARSGIKIMSQSCLVQHANMRQYKSARENCGVEIRLRPYFGQIFFRYFAITCEEVSVFGLRIIVYFKLIFLFKAPHFRKYVDINQLRRLQRWRG